jgi:hypothetical protein
VQLAVIVVVAAVAAATFMLSYAGVHAVALEAGVPLDLARYYPGILDAVLVIACAAAPVLRDARWWVRCYAWLAILIVVVVIGGIDAVYAMNVALPRRATAGVAAVLPWALLLLAFSLWLTILRHLRAQHLAREPEVADAAEVAITRKALEAAAAPVAPVVAGDGVATEKPGAAEANAASGASREAEAPEEPGARQATVPATVRAEESATVREPDHEPDKAGEPDKESVSHVNALRDKAGPDENTVPDRNTGPDKNTARDENTGPDENTVPDRNTGPDEETGLDDNTGPTAEPGRSSGDRPEAITEVPAITYASGPRLRRVRSLPAPPVDDE